MTQLQLWRERGKKKATRFYLWHTLCGNARVTVRKRDTEDERSWENSRKKCLNRLAMSILGSPPPLPLSRSLPLLFATAAVGAIPCEHPESRADCGAGAAHSPRPCGRARPMRSRHGGGLRWSSGRQRHRGLMERGKDGLKEGGRRGGGIELWLRGRRRKRDAGKEIKGKWRSAGCRAVEGCFDVAQGGERERCVRGVGGGVSAPTVT